MILQILKSQVNYCHSLKAAKRLYPISISHNFVKQNMASAWVVHYGKSNHNQFNFVYQKNHQITVSQPSKTCHSCPFRDS